MKYENPTLVLTFEDGRNSQTIGIEWIIKDSIKFEETLLNELAPSSNILTLSLRRGCPSISALMEGQSDIKALFHDGGEAIFTGYISNNYSYGVNQYGEEEFKLTIESISTRKLSIAYLTDGYYTFNCSSVVAIKAICDKAGIEVNESTLPIMNVFRVVQADETCKTLLDSLFKEMGYTYYFNPLGVLKAKRISLETENVVQIESRDLHLNNNRAVKIDKKARKQQGAIVSYSKLANKNGVLIYKAEPFKLSGGEWFNGGEKSEEESTALFTEAVNAGDDMDIGSGKIYSLSSISTDIDKDSAVSFDMLDPRANYISFQMHNTGTAEASVRKLELRANVVYEQSQEKVRLNEAYGIKEDKLEWLHEGYQAEAKAKQLNRYYSFGSVSYTFYSKRDIAVGSIVHLSESVFSGLDAYMFINKKANNSNLSFWQYTGFGISELTLNENIRRESIKDGYFPRRGKDGVVGKDGRSLFLSCSTPYFHINADGDCTTQSIVVTAKAQNITEPLVWTLPNKSVRDNETSVTVMPSDMGLAPVTLTNLITDNTAEWEGAGTSYNQQSHNYQQTAGHKYYARLTVKYESMDGGTHRVMPRPHISQGTVALNNNYPNLIENTATVLSSIVTENGGTATKNFTFYVYTDNTGGTQNGAIRTFAKEFVLIDVTNIRDEIASLSNATDAEIKTYLDGFPYFLGTQVLATTTTTTYPITVTAGDYSDTLTLGVVRDGVQGIQGIPGQDGQDGKDGDVVSQGWSQATINLYKRAENTNTYDGERLEYQFSTGGVTGNTGTWSRTIPSGDAKLWIISASAFANATSDLIEISDWTTPAVLSENGTIGQDGYSVFTVILYQRGTTAPERPTTTATYNFQTHQITGVGDWSLSPVEGDGALYVTSATASTRNTIADNIEPTEWSAVQELVKDGAKGDKGDKGDKGEPGITRVNSFIITPSKYTFIQNQRLPDTVNTIQIAISKYGYTSDSVTYETVPGVTIQNDTVTIPYVGIGANYITIKAKLGDDEATSHFTLEKKIEGNTPIALGYMSEVPTNAGAYGDLIDGDTYIGADSNNGLISYLRENGAWVEKTLDRIQGDMQLTTAMQYITALGIGKGTTTQSESAFFKNLYSSSAIINLISSSNIHMSNDGVIWGGEAFNADGTLKTDSNGDDSYINNESLTGFRITAGNGIDIYNKYLDTGGFKTKAIETKNKPDNTASDTRYTTIATGGTGYSIKQAQAKINALVNSQPIYTDDGTLANVNPSTQIISSSFTSYNGKRFVRLGNYNNTGTKYTKDNLSTLSISNLIQQQVTYIQYPNWQCYANFPLGVNVEFGGDVYVRRSNDETYKTETYTEYGAWSSWKRGEMQVSGTMSCPSDTSTVQYRNWTEEDSTGLTSIYSYETRTRTATQKTRTVVDNPEYYSPKFTATLTCGWSNDNLATWHTISFNHHPYDRVLPNSKIYLKVDWGTDWNKAKTFYNSSSWDNNYSTSNAYIQVWWSAYCAYGNGDGRFSDSQLSTGILINPSDWTATAYTAPSFSSLENGISTSAFSFRIGTGMAITNLSCNKLTKYLGFSGLAVNEKAYINLSLDTLHVYNDNAQNGQSDIQSTDVAINSDLNASGYVTTGSNGTFSVRNARMSQTINGGVWVTNASINGSITITASNKEAGVYLDKLLVKGDTSGTIGIDTLAGSFNAFIRYLRVREGLLLSGGANISGGITVTGGNVTMDSSTGALNATNVTANVNVQGTANRVWGAVFN